jgi:outer membrane protein TolC
MKIFLGLFLPLFVFGQSYGLKTLVDHANKENRLIKAKEISIKSKVEQVEAAKSAYWPTLDIGASHSSLSPNNIVSPGETSSAFALISMDIYDGGRKSAVLRSKEYEYEASLFEKIAFEKSITLDIVRHYYEIQKFKSTLEALNERSAELKEQIKRVKKFKGAGLSTQEEVDKLQAEYDSNSYTMANAKLELLRSEKNLQLLSGLPAKSLKNNIFKNLKMCSLKFLITLKCSKPMPMQLEKMLM